MPTSDRCVIRTKRGRKVAIAALEYSGLGKAEDRRPHFRRFVQAFVRRLAEVNPQAQIRLGMPRWLRRSWIVLLLAAVIIGPLALILIVYQLVAGEPVNVASLFGVVILLIVAAGFRSRWNALRRDRSRLVDPQAGHLFNDS
jgi:hypothetical protein